MVGPEIPLLNGERTLEEGHRLTRKALLEIHPGELGQRHCNERVVSARHPHVTGQGSRLFTLRAGVVAEAGIDEGQYGMDRCHVLMPGAVPPLVDAERLL